jgi:hypothetical protein
MAREGSIGDKIARATIWIHLLYDFNIYMSSYTVINDYWPTYSKWTDPILPYIIKC